MALIQGELDTFGPLQRGEALTPRDLALLESNVKRAVQVTSPSPSLSPLTTHHSPLTTHLSASPSLSFSPSP